MTRRIEIVVNPAAGPGLALALVEKHIKPLLTSRFAQAVSIRQTPPPGDDSDSENWKPQDDEKITDVGHSIFRDYIDASSKDGVIDVVLVGGDGTTHEVLAGLYQPIYEEWDKDRGNQPLPKIRLAIVPAGTANALYSAMYPDEWTQEKQQQAANASSVEEIPEDVLVVMLKSVHALAESASMEAESEERLSGLPLMLNETITGEGVEGDSISHLVTSHALHAAILHDADTPEMRAKHKGIERFKAAAQMNATKWTYGELTLHPDGSDEVGGVQRYSPRTKRFENVGEGKVDLEGWFLYLNAMVTDRLESAFIPAPLSSAFTRPGLPGTSIDVVIIRPMRDPEISIDDEVGVVKFAATRLGPITAGMYDGGKHIDLLYSDAQPMVEYFRCSAYDFIPEVRSEGDNARLICTDGFIDRVDRVRVSRWDSEMGRRKREELAKWGSLRNMDAPLLWR